MKYLKINYGNNKHNAIVKELLKKEDNLYMIYYDLTKHSEKASQLIIDNGNYLKDKDIEINIINNIGIIPQDPLVFEGSLSDNIDPYHTKTDNEIISFLLFELLYLLPLFYYL